MFSSAWAATYPLKVGSHKALPLGIDLFFGHAIQGSLKALRRPKTAKAQPIVTHEQAAVVLTCSPQGVQRFRPDCLVVFLILFDLVVF
jgi:hypothetical protein